MDDTTGQGQATNDEKIEEQAEAAPEQAAPAAPVDTTPTRAEAREMFKGNPGLWAVVTTEGRMTRDEC